MRERGREKGRETWPDHLGGRGGKMMGSRPCCDFDELVTQALGVPEFSLVK